MFRGIIDIIFQNVWKIITKRDIKFRALCTSSVEGQTQSENLETFNRDSKLPRPIILVKAYVRDTQCHHSAEGRIIAVLNFRSLSNYTFQRRLCLQVRTNKQKLFLS